MNKDYCGHAMPISRAHKHTQSAYVLGPTQLMPNPTYKGCSTQTVIKQEFRMFQLSISALFRKNNGIICTNIYTMLKKVHE